MSAEPLNQGIPPAAEHRSYMLPLETVQAIIDTQLAENPPRDTSRRIDWLALAGEETLPDDVGRAAVIDLGLALRERRRAGDEGRLKVPPIGHITLSSLHERYGRHMSTMPGRLTADFEPPNDHETLELLAMNVAGLRAAAKLALVYDSSSEVVAKDFLVERGRFARNVLCAAFEPLIHRYIRARASGVLYRSRAEDILGDSLEGLMTMIDNPRLDQKRAGWTFKPAFYVMIHHKVFDGLRARRRDRHLYIIDGPYRDTEESGSQNHSALLETVDGPDLAEKLYMDRVGQSLHELLEYLPERQFAAYVLRVAYKLSGAAAAHALGTSPGAVRVAQHRAQEWLRAQIFNGADDTEELRLEAVNSRQLQQELIGDALERLKLVARVATVQADVGRQEDARVGTNRLKPTRSRIGSPPAEQVDPISEKSDVWQGPVGDHEARSIAALDQLLPAEILGDYLPESGATVHCEVLRLARQLMFEDRCVRLQPADIGVINTLALLRANEKAPWATADELRALGRFNDGSPAAAALASVSSESISNLADTINQAAQHPVMLQRRGAHGRVQWSMADALVFADEQSSVRTTSIQEGLEAFVLSRLARIRSGDQSRVAGS